MKAIMKNRMFGLLAALAFLAASCAQEEESFFPSLSNGPQTGLIGSLLDMGPVSDSSRVMVLTLENYGNLFSVNAVDAVGSGEQIKLTVFTDADGHLPTGTYTFNEGDSSLPYTIKNGEVFAKFNDSLKSNELLLVSGGSVSITFDGNLYFVDFSLTLHSDHFIEGTANGKLAYADL